MNGRQHHTYGGKDPATYPTTGLKYIATHPSLWGKVLCAALVGLSVAIAVLVLLLAFALAPQAAAFGGGRWWSYVLALIAVLFEAALVSALLLAALHSKTQKGLFVETMRLELRWREGTMVEPSVLGDLNCFKLGVLVKIVTFPLHLIPFAGTVLFAYVNAPFAGLDWMDLYFDSICMSGRARRVEAFGGERGAVGADSYGTSNPYTRFGFVCLLLEAVPIAGTAIFPLSNAVGAALFACDVEASGGPASLRRSEADVGSYGAAAEPYVAPHPSVAIQ